MNRLTCLSVYRFLLAIFRTLMIAPFRDFPNLRLRQGANLCLTFICNPGFFVHLFFFFLFFPPTNCQATHSCSPMPPNEWVQRPITLVRLPEVIREILLEYLPREDKESLARVCKGWGVTVQRYMFSSVHLRWDDGPRYSTQWVPSVLGNLHLIITSNPIIATYIKSLIIEDGSDTGLYAPWFLNQTDVLTDVFDIIQSHSPLRKLVITSNYKPFYWSFLKPGVRWKVLELLEKSTLEYVEIDAIRMLSEEFFMRCRSVKSLVVRQCGFPYLNMYRKKRLWDTIGVPTGTVRLESLRIDFSAFDPDLSITPFLHVNNGLNLSKLRELTLWSCHKYPPSYRVFCDIRTLKHLNIIWVPPEEDDVVHCQYLTSH